MTLRGLPVLSHRLLKRRGRVSTGSAVAAHAATDFLLETLYVPAMYVASLYPLFILRYVTEYLMKNLTERGYSDTTFTERLHVRNVKEMVCYNAPVSGSQTALCFPSCSLRASFSTSMLGPVDCVARSDALRFFVCGRFVTRCKDILHQKKELYQHLWEKLGTTENFTKFGMKAMKTNEKMWRLFMTSSTKAAAHLGSKYIDNLEVH